jgi:transcriptional regulator with PAS, ATPase and Fis domain
MGNNPKNTAKEIKTEIIGDSYIPLMSSIEKRAEWKHSILIIGETGMGKELLAKYYAACAKRKIAPVNCAAFPKELLGSELFGHVEGAYTGANRDRPGLLASSSEEVVFLDEIGDASKEMQAQILRVIEYGDYKPLGSDEQKKIDKILFVAATNKEKAVRNDLKARFREIVRIPYLNDRVVAQLIQSQLCLDSKISHIEEGALAYLFFHPYPGNVREIKTTVEDTIKSASSSTGKSEKIIVRKIDLPDKSFDVSMCYEECEDFYNSERLIEVHKIEGHCDQVFPIHHVIKFSKKTLRDKELEKLGIYPPEKLTSEHFYRSLAERHMLFEKDPLAFYLLHPNRHICQSLQEENIGRTKGIIRKESIMDKQEV